MFAPTRDQARGLFFETWRKYRAGEPLEGLETVVLGVLTAHPEYHALLDRPAEHLQADYVPDAGQVNPFLHLSLHLAIEEQLSIDQPPGIRERYQALIRRLGSEHDAKHAVLECLAETLWQAQRHAASFDPNVYLDCLARQDR